MKYNENDIKNLFNNELRIWESDDLDWFDKKLVLKLQNNQLDHDEKQRLIDMMKNDQMVMNRYLQLKNETKVESLSFWNFLKPKMTVVLTSVMALILAVIFFNQEEINYNFDQDITRGVGLVKIYPQDNSIIESPLGFLLVENKKDRWLKVKLYYNNQQIWISPFQKSNKFHIPFELKTKLNKGKYKWTITSKDGNTNDTYTFTLQ